MPLSKSESLELERLKDLGRALMAKDAVKGATKGMSRFDRLKNYDEIEGARADILATVSPSVLDGLLSAQMATDLDRAGVIATSPVYGASALLRDFVGLLAPGLVDKIDDLDMRLHQATGGKLGTPHTLDPHTQNYIRKQAFK